MPPNEKAFIKPPDFIQSLSHLLSRLYWAIETGNDLLCRQLLADVSPGSITYSILMDHRDHAGLTSFLHAVVKGNIGIVRYFVEELSSDLYVECTDEPSSLAVHLAAEYGHLDIVKYLIDFCPEMANALDDSGNNAMHRAASAGKLDVLQYFIKVKNCPSATPNQDGQTALHLAAEKGHLDLVHYLVSSWPHLTRLRDTSDNLPLHLAAAENRRDVLAYLIEKGCGVDADGNDGQTALHLACSNGHLDLTRYLVSLCPDLVSVRDNDDNMAVHLASTRGHLDIVKFLVTEANCPVDSTGEDDRTSLHLAALSGHLGIVRFLAENNADLYAEDSCWNRTPYHWAAHWGFLDIVKYLHELQPELMNQEDGNCGLPIHAAAEGNHLEVLKFFVEECGQHFDTKANESEWTPLAVAVSNKQDSKDCIHYLIERGADLTVRVSMHRLSLLHLAVSSDRLGLIDELLNIKPELINLRDNNGQTALEYAITESKTAAIALLQQRTTSTAEPSSMSFTSSSDSN